MKLFIIRLKKKPATGTVNLIKLDDVPQVPEVLSGTGTHCSD
jgi:hypothetical protein